MAMTAPVIMAETKPETMSMTAPVVMNEATSMENMTMSFVVPSKYTMYVRLCTCKALSLLFQAKRTQFAYLIL